MTLQNSSSMKPVAAHALEQIIVLLPELSKSELKILQTAVEKEFDKYVEIDRELYHLVFEIVGEKPIAINRFSQSDNGLIWRKNIWAFIEVEKALGVYGANPPRKGVCIALRRFLIELLIEDMKASYLPVTLKRVCQHLGQMQGVFERQFPGYLKNGLGGMVIAKLGGKNGS